MLGVWIIKRDFRLLDNEALYQAVRHCEQVIPLFVFEDILLNSEYTSRFHLDAMLSALRDLQDNIRKIGGDILIKDGDIIFVLEEILKSFNISYIFAHEEIGVDETFKRDKKLRKWAKSNRIVFNEYSQTGVFRGLKNRDKWQGLWESFMAQHIVPAPDMIKVPLDYIRQNTLDIDYLKQKLIDNFDCDLLQKVSEKKAHKTLDTFLKYRGRLYQKSISSPNTAFYHGSRLSVYLAWGTISPRVVVQKTRQRLKELSDDVIFQRSLNAFLGRMYWRDHFIQRLEMEPEMEFHALNPIFENPPYKFDKEKLEAWYHGRTGFPLVDACMVCLHKTGFLNFRMRSLVTSFACHVLHLDWRDINKLLARIFLDFEPGIHISQLQMQAGVVGINVIRVYSPHKQLLDQDPKLKFVRRWLPELEEIPDEEILNNKNTGIKGYIPVICDYEKNSKVMKDYLYSLKKHYKDSETTQRVLKKHGSRRNIFHRQR
ncbi:MAG: deoxyribodipyrimidine photo-lyase [Candidatus Dojkabacteria bacterium]|nr:deoxyribodipyrimidine photo-lyase [Candidatus Dojkabacteria bacterium]